MSTELSIKPTFEQYIQKWVLVDNQLKELQEKTKKVREWKHKLTNVITEKMTEKEWKHKIFEIPNGEIKCFDRKEYSSLTFGYIEECMKQIIPNEKEVQFVMDYLREHREMKIVSDLRRTNFETK
jgi:hypothetical protein